jgi:hypothetical protein
MNKFMFITQTRIHILFTFVFSCVFFAFFQFLLNQSNFLETSPIFEAVTPQKERALANAPPIVDIGLSVRNFSYMNMKEGRFKIEGTLWFLFKPGEISLKTIEQFDIERGTLLKKSAARAKLHHQKILASFDVTIEFLSQLEHKKFPVTDHRIFLIVKMGEVSKSELTFNATHSGIMIAPDVQQQTWKLKEYRAQTGYYSEILDGHNEALNVSRPVAMFSFDFENPGFRVLLLLLIPEFILFLFGLFSLIIPFKDAAGSINLSIGSISGLIVHRFVVENISPDVGYFTFFDKIYVFFLLANLSFFLFNIIFSNEERHILLKNIIFYVTQIVFTVYVYGIIDS